jgi:two-component system phosphate regulon sensor histidine kinase PhoR
MASRFFSFLVCQLAAGLLGWWLGLARGAAVGLVSGGMLWLALDTWRGARMLRWLRQGAVSASPPAGGMWGEASSRAERALRLREQEVAAAQRRLEEFLSAIRTSPNGVVLLDQQGRIEWCNQTAADQFGIDPQRDLMQQVTNLMRDPAFAAYYYSGSFGRDVAIPGPGSLPSRPVKLAVHLHPYGEGRKLLLSRDVTAVEQAEAMRRDFVANVSHEIRTPLTVLAGFVETLQNLPLDEEERRRYLALMAQQAHRMQTLVNDLLTLSRLEGSPLPGAGEWTPVAELMAQCGQEGQALSKALGKSQELRFGDPPAVEIAGSSGELLSALSNLVSNAVRYTPAAGSIDVQWHTLPDGRGELSVRDSGPGIAPEHLSRLTERFYRVDRSRSRETGGTGLGLAIVKHVAQRHGAKLRIDSTPGLGSTFAIRFPASRLRAVLSPPSDSPAQPATESLEG